MTNKIKKSELIVFTKMKDLNKYIFQIVEKSPKKFRFSLVSKMQNISLNIIEEMYIANEIFVAKERIEEINKKLDLKRQIITRLKVLDYISEVAKEQTCILPKQYLLISQQISECKNLVGAWMKSDQRMLEQVIDKSIIHEKQLLSNNQAMIPQ